MKGSGSDGVENKNTFIHDSKEIFIFTRQSVQTFSVFSLLTHSAVHSHKNMIQNDKHKPPETQLKSQGAFRKEFYQLPAFLFVF